MNGLKKEIMKYLKILIIILSIISINSCDNKKIKRETSIKKTLVRDSIYKLTEANVNSEGPFLFNNGEEIIINWTEWSKEREHNILKFAFFDKKKKQFRTAHDVPVSKTLQMHAESMAKVAINKQGVLYAIFRLKPKNDSSRFGGLLYYSISKDKGKTWSEKVRLVSDTKSTSQSFYDIALLPDGNLGMVWLDSREIEPENKGKTVYFAKTDLDRGFMPEKPIAGSTCECCRTEIYVDGNKRIHVAYRNIIERGEQFYDDNFGTTDVEIRDMYYLYSDDETKTFTTPIPISRDNWHINGCPHTGPSLALNNDKLGAVWFTADNGNAGLFFTTKTKDNFSERVLLTNEGRHPQMVVLSGEFHIVFEEYYEKDEKGFTKIVLESIDENNLINTVEISNTLSNNNHAVLTNVDSKTLLIAWVNTDTRNPKIYYTVHSLANN